jgi:hypothetical protein
VVIGRNGDRAKWSLGEMGIGQNERVGRDGFWAK